jgi:8-oxo-dGTP diphosphatase
MKARPPLLVSAGIIFRNGQVLVGQRRKGDRHALKWEFPGGKVEQGETPREALVRELWEELRILARVDGELARYEHDYPSGSRVHLLFFAVPEFAGEPVGHIYEQICWIELASLPTLDFLEGDLDFIRRLSRGDFAEHLA